MSKSSDTLDLYTILDNKGSINEIKTELRYKIFTEIQKNLTNDGLCKKKFKDGNSVERQAINSIIYDYLSHHKLFFASSVFLAESNTAVEKIFPNNSINKIMNIDRDDYFSNSNRLNDASYLDEIIKKVINCSTSWSKLCANCHNLFYSNKYKPNLKNDTDNQPDFTSLNPFNYPKNATNFEYFPIQKNSDLLNYKIRKYELNLDESYKNKLEMSIEQFKLVESKRISRETREVVSNQYDNKILTICQDYEQRLSHMEYVYKSKMEMYRNELKNKENQILSDKRQIEIQLDWVRKQEDKLEDKINTHNYDTKLFKSEIDQFELKKSRLVALENRLNDEINKECDKRLKNEHDMHRSRITKLNKMEYELDERERDIYNREQKVILSEKHLLDDKNMLQEMISSAKEKSYKQLERDEFHKFKELDREKQFFKNLCDKMYMKTSACSSLNSSLNKYVSGEKDLMEIEKKMSQLSAMEKSLNRTKNENTANYTRQNNFKLYNQISNASVDSNATQNSDISSIYTSEITNIPDETTIVLDHKETSVENEIDTHTYRKDNKNNDHELEKKNHFDNENINLVKTDESNDGSFHSIMKLKTPNPSIQRSEKISIIKETPMINAVETKVDKIFIQKNIETSKRDVKIDIKEETNETSSTSTNSKTDAFGDW
ncbi:hypothetical protein A3Q56_00261 [Intoshia linei]|uniref:Uncharacterized protein n=1 Tax=Intoshia linei TaxID=1819745 RepID=A0A177BCN5_9BILA|nr:hypothetical protein A3Q56_00261 [Intoshia linei]